jgi:2-dehydropantoate 2-reductase
MRIAIVGTGGVGGYLGGRLAQAGEEVVFIARGQHLQAMRQRGLRVDSINGDFSLNPVQATDNPAEAGPVEVVIVAVKGWQVAEAAQAMQPLVGDQTFIVPFLNGIEAAHQLANVYGPERVVHGFCQIVSFIAGPGHIQHTGVEPVFSFGEADNRRSPRIEQLYQAIERAQGVTPHIPADIQAAVWTKFLLISPWSCIGSLTQAPVGAWRSVPETRELWQQLMAELMALAQANQINLTEAKIERTMAFVDQLAPQLTASMQRDVMAGKPSEMETQVGAVIRLAAESSLAVPAYRFVYGCLHPLELRARGQLSF